MIRRSFSPVPNPNKDAVIQAIRAFSPRQLLILIVLLKIVLGALYITQQPLWQYHEADFLRVVRSLRDEGQLPVLAEDATPDRNNSSQPPLYYFILLPFVSALDDNQTVPAGLNPTAVCDGYNTNLTSLLTTTAYDPPYTGTIALGYVLRFLSLVMSIVGVVFTYLAGRVLFPDKPYVALLGAGLLAFEPTSVIVGSQINNDNLILALGAIHLWLCARLIHQRGGLVRNLVGLLVVAVLGLLSKLSGWLMLGMSILLIAGILVQMSRQRASQRQKRVAIGIGVVLVLAVMGIGVFNLAQYGSLFGRYRNLDATIQSTLLNLPPRHVALMTTATLQDTLADYLSPLRQLQPRNAVLFAYIGLLGVCGVVGLFGIGRAVYRREKSALLSFGLLVVYALLMVGLVIFRAILNNGTPDFINSMIIISPVRYYAPALPALLLIVGAGFGALATARLPQVGRMGGVLVTACWLVVAFGSTWILIKDNQTRGAAVMSQEAFDRLQNVTPVSQPSPDELPQVVGYQITPQPDAGLVDLNLYVKASQPLTESYALQTTLSGSGQSSSCVTVPVGGLLPTTRWPTDQVIVLHTEIPNCIARREPPINLDIQWLQAQNINGIATTTATGTPIQLAQLSEGLGVAVNCPVNKGIIGGGLQLLKYNAPTTLTLQNQPTYYIPSVNWLVRDVPTDAYVRVYLLIQASTNTVYQCGGEPRQDTYPFKRWSAGETVFFDECVMTIPPDAPKGEYVVSVGVQDTAGQWLGAVDSDGTVIENGRIPISTLNIQ
ncbi:MAG: glycosyltransferase family 39 protein [Chloroflexi bacterium]|nr:glycosyltransferase family 39 protein [Chloroflexota bacterium]MCC6895907.1 glycosyltransferase family 39 protein [Anaerolineae bacterium]